MELFNEGIRSSGQKTKQNRSTPGALAGAGGIRYHEKITQCKASNEFRGKDS